MYNVHKEVTEQILGQLKAGTKPWVKPWKAIAGGNVPKNAVTQRPYSGVNVVLLWLAAEKHGWTNLRFLTAKQAIALGGDFKGQKATRIIFMKPYVKKAKGKDEEDLKRLVMREYNVFNVEQVKGLPENIVNSDVLLKTDQVRNAEAEEFIVATGAEFREGSGEAYYVPSKDFISMPSFAAFKTADHYYTTAFHEIGHWTGAKKRLNRDYSKRYENVKHNSKMPYALEELVAELTAAFLNAEFGFDATTLDHNAAYIDNWISLLTEDDKAFFTAAAAASKATEYLRELALKEEAKVEATTEAE